jgi:predicted aminopeptidase
LVHEQTQNNLPLTVVFPFLQSASWCQRGLVAVLLALLTGCADLGYVLQSAQGHFGMLQAAKPVDDWLAEPHPSVPLKRQLELAQRMRRFAVTELGLPDNASYTRYADVKRTAVVWNVVAAPKFSLTLKTWCFPVAGCVGYRGYFDEADARAMAAELKAEGLEVSVYGVPAYSTLGWMNWAGGDPLLNTFIHYPDGELARLIFHELAHQVAYAKDDTTFNESFATAVERLGGNRWLAQHGSPAAKRQFDANTERRSQFRALTQATRAVLTKAYESNSDKADNNAKNIAIKEIAMAEFRANYARLRADWQSRSTAPQNFGFYDNWVANANNASLGAQAAYDELVPQFEALFLRIAAQSTLPQQSPWPKFYDAVQQLAALPKVERRKALAEPLAAPLNPLAEKK